MAPKIDEVPTAFTYHIVESYCDGLETFMLLKVVKNKLGGYMVVQVGGCEAKNRFILPEQALQDGEMATTFLLRVGNDY